MPLCQKVEEGSKMQQKVKTEEMWEETLETPRSEAGKVLS